MCQLMCCVADHVMSIGNKTVLQSPKWKNWTKVQNSNQLSRRTTIGNSINESDFKGMKSMFILLVEHNILVPFCHFVETVHLPFGILV